MTEIVYKPPYDSSDKQFQDKPRMDWQKLCLYYGRRITLCRSTHEARNDLYVVPTGKLLLLLSAFLSTTSQNVTFETEARLYIRANGDEDELTLLRAFTGVNPGVFADDNSNNSNLAINYPIPMIIRATEVISVETVEVGTDAAGGIFGYEVDAQLFYSLL